MKSMYVSPFYAPAGTFLLTMPHHCQLQKSTAYTLATLVLLPPYFTLKTVIRTFPRYLFRRPFLDDTFFYEIAVYAVMFILQVCNAQSHHVQHIYQLHFGKHLLLKLK